MITVPLADLWVLLALWLAVVVCGFLFGWHAGRYWRPDPAEVDRAVRRHPANRQDRLNSEMKRYLADHRPGRLDLEDDPTSIDIARHWHVLERDVGPQTAPLSRAEVEISNWEARIARDNRAWMHQHGVRDGQD
jgi:hypothetical protein